MAAKIATVAALAATIFLGTAHAAAGDAVAVDLGDGTAQVYVEQPDGSYTADGDPFIITPPPPPDPAPEPAPPAPARFPQGADVTPLVYSAAPRWGVSTSLLLCIGRYESHLGTDPLTYLPWRTHRGPYQFDRVTWQEQAPIYGLPAAWDAALDPQNNVELAAALMGHGQLWRWTTRRYC